MRFATFKHDRRARVGAVDDGVIRPIRGCKTMIDLIERWVSGRRIRFDNQECFATAAVELMVPVFPPVRNFICVGWNYVVHIEEGMGKRMGQDPKELPTLPTFFTKATTAANPAFGDIPLHRDVTAKLDWEAELAVVVGPGGRDIAERDALEHVFGYCVANDISARELQRTHGGQWFKGKSLDGSCPLGPWIVTRDEISDPQQLDVICRVNGKVKQHGNTRDQIFTVAKILSVLSRGFTLLPGDIILTGSPEGVGYTRTPPEFLGEGDVVETEIPGIGLLRNTVRP